MWRTFLELGSERSLHPRPWTVWRLQPEDGVAVLEIDSARGWRDFVQAFPRVRGRFISPDWTQVACEYDAVHITLAAIIATQAFTFAATPHVIAPSYWDIETTLWLRWCFTAVTQVEVVPPPGR